MKRYLLSFLTGITCWLLAGEAVRAQTQLELSAGSAPTNINGPTTLPLSATLLENTTGTTFTAATPAVTVGVSLSNQQYNGTYGNITTGAVFGAGPSSTASATAVPLSQAMSSVGSPVGSAFTSSPCGPAGTGIDVNANYGLRFFLSTKPLAGKATTGRYQYADLTLTFSQAVTNPVIQIVGLGDTFTGGGLLVGTEYFTTELELLTSGVTLSKLSGSPELSVVGSTTIANGAAQPSASCGSGAACGSIRATGMNITTLTFRLYLRGVGTAIIGPVGASVWDNTNAHAGDSFILGVSLDKAPTPTATTLTNICPATTADLTTLQPAGTTFEWHTTASSPSTATKVSNPAAVGAGTYYLYSLTNTNCYSPASVPVTVTIQACSSTCAYIANGDFEVSGQNPADYVISSQTTLVPPWRTTASDGQMELWHTGYQGVPAYSGNQFIELNANLAATTYQNFTAAPGSTFTLNFAHRGRSGIDVVNVSIGSAIASTVTTGTAVTGTIYNNLGSFSDDNTAWGYYSRTFTIPLSATGTSFSLRFTTVSSAGGNESAGNFLDAISVADVAPALNSASVPIVCPATTTDLSSVTVTSKPANTTQTYHSGPVATPGNKLTSTVVGPGTYYTAFYSGTKLCYGATTAISVTLTTPAAPTATATAQPTCVLATGTITVTAPTGAGLTYSIDGTNYTSSPTFSGLAAGTYAVTVRNGSAVCTSPATSVVINAAPTTPAAPSVILAQPTCTLATGTITVTAPTGMGLTYSINGSTYASTTAFTGVAAGTYSVTVRNATGCVSSPTSVTINAQPATPSAILSSATICNGTSTTLTAGGAGAGGTYVFSTGVSNTTGFLPVSPVVNGTNPYSVTVTSAQGCSAVATGTVTVNPSVTATLSSATICNGTSATLTATGGASYLFSTGVSNTTGLLAVTPTTNGSTPYSVTVTSAQGCSAVAGATVTVNAAVTATLTSATFCTSDNAILVATGGSSYAFSNGTSNTSGSLVLSPGVGGTYSVTVTSAQGCSAVATGTATSQTCSPAGCTNALINPGLESPVVSATNGVGSLYYGNAVPGWYAPFASGIGLARVNGAGFANGPNNAEDGNQYVFINATGDFLAQNFTLSCASSLNFSGYFANNSTYGTYAPWTAQITILDAGGNIVASSATKAFTSAIGDETWYPLTGSSVVLPAGNYRFYVKVTSSGYFDAASLCITPCPACATPILSTTAITNACSATTGDLSTITAGNAPASTSLTFHSATPATSANTVSNSVASGTYYAAFYSPSSNCYGPTVPVSVTVVPTPAAPTVSVTQPTCTLATGTIVVTAPTGTGLTYSINGTTYTGAATFAGVTAGVYPVTVKNTIGCVSTATSVTVIAQPATPSAALSSATICNGTSTTLTATGGASYVFSTGVSNTTGLIVVNPVVNGTNPYSVTVTSAQGCSAVATGTVTVNPSVTATLSSATICNGTSATLTATGGASYLFSTGVSNTTGLLAVTPTTNGTNPYSVTVTSAQGCSAVATGTVTVNPSVTATLSSATICNGTSVTLTATGGSSYIFSTGLSNTTGFLPVNPVANGTNPYSVTVTSAQGCSAVATGTVTVNPSVTATLSSATICNGTSVTLTATGGSSYIFSTGVSNTTGFLPVNPVANGTNPYSVTVTSAQGCSAVATGTVTVNPSVTATLSSATICNGTSTTLTATGGASYVFSTGLSNTTGFLPVSPVVNGTNPYSVTVTSAQGCSAVATGTVTVNPSVTATLSSATICNGTSTTLTATGGASYVFSTGLSNTTGFLPVSPVVNGTNPYSVTVTSAQGCSAVATGTVTVNPSVTATLSSATICNGTSTTLTATGGASYVFSTGLSNTTGFLPVSPVVNGTNPYSVTVTSAQGCSAVATGTVTVNPSVTATLSSATICNGTSVTLTATGGSSYIFSTGVSNTTGFLPVSPVVNGTNPYSATVTSAQGCSAVATGTVTVNPSVTATLSSATICNGTSATLTATGGASYLFSTGVSNTTGLLAVTPTTNGTNPYSVTVTSTQGCSAVATGTVTVNPSVTATLSSATICNGTSATLTATGGSSYIFSMGVSNTTGLLAVTPTTNGSTPYSVTVTSAQGCTAVATGTVTVNPSVTATLSSATICNGTSVTLTATGGSSYIFSTGVSNTTGFLPVSPVVNGTNPYSVTVTSAQGCTAVATGTVTVNPSVTATLSSATICNGTSTTLTATGGTSYRFGPGNMNATGLLTVAPTTNGSTPYSVTVTSAQGCTAVATGTVTVNALPQPTIAGNTSVCAGQPISLTVSPITGLTYAWSGPGGNLGSSNPLTIVNSTSANSGTYQVRVTDVNGCTATASQNVTVKPVPQAQILNTSIVCASNSPAVAITTQVTGGTPPVGYAWYRSGAAGIISTAPNPVFSVADTYSLIVTDASGCLSNTATVVVMTPNPLSVNVRTTNARCFGAQGSITVTTNGGTAPYTIGYYNGSGLISSTTTSGVSTLQTIAGSYTVVVMDTNGCSLTQTATVTQPPLLMATLTGSGPVCTGQNTGSIASSVTGGTVPYSYSWSNGATTPNLTGLSGGTYSVTVTDANGCTTSQTVTLPTNPLPDTPTVSVTQPTCVTVTGTIQMLTPATGVQYSFNNGIAFQVSPTRTGLSPDVYQVRVRDNSTGCVSLPASVTINPVPNPPLVAIAGTTTYCAGQPISLTASPIGGVSYAWSGPSGSLGSTNPLVITNTTPAQTGAYRVTVTDANGCTAVATTTLLVYALPVATLTVNSTTMCYGQPISLTAGGGVSYAFSPNVAGISGNTASFTAALGTAQYSVTATSAQGCLSAPTVLTVTVSSCVVPSPDSGTASSGTGGVAVINVVANDLINTLPATLGVGGNATIAPLGNYPPGISLDPATGALTVAVGTAPGAYSLTYQLCDRLSPTTCATTTITLLVSPAPPVVTDDINTVNRNTPAIGNVLTNDFDPQGLPLLVSLTTPPPVGTLLLSPTGSYTYTPPADFTGPVSFTYSACNPAALCRPAVVTIDVLANPTVGNNPPLARNDATRTPKGQALRIVVLANDSDPDSPATANGRLTTPVLVSPPAAGTAVVNPDGSITYSPPATFTGVVSFGYQLCDSASPALCSVAQVTVTVQQPALAGTVLAPVGVDDGFLVRQNTVYVGDVSANDMDLNSPVQSLSYLAGQAVSGTVVLSGVGSYTYTPAAGFSGPVSFTYSVCNTAGLCDVATVYGVVQVTDKVALLGKVYLQGALLGVYSPSVLMRDDLRARGLLPATSPYGSYGALTGVGGIGASVTGVTGSDAIVDWVYVELRSPVSSSVVVDSRSALLQRDGDIVDVDGVSAVRFDVAVAGSYYVAVRHRNHLGAMSGLSLPLSVSGLVVDFRSGATPMFSYTASALNQALVVVDQGVALWAGNVLSDGAAATPHEVVQFQGTNNDPNAVYQRVIGSLGNFFVTPFYKLKGYYDTDIDMNGETLFQGSGNDVETIYQNIIKNHSGNQFAVPFFRIREQLP